MYSRNDYRLRLEQLLAICINNLHVIKNSRTHSDEDKLKSLVAIQTLHIPEIRRIFLYFQNSNNPPSFPPKPPTGGAA